MTFAQDDWLSREPPVFSVSDVTGAIKEALEESFPHLRVRGEISNLSQPRSGHLYFSLLESDGPARPGSRIASSQLPCVLWRSNAARLRVEPVNGMKVIVTGRIGVYEPRGTYQLIGEQLEPEGQGELQRLFEELKTRLRAEGLFDSDRKRPLPFLPRRIGLVTSPSGAAIQDFLRILYRRSPTICVRVIPVRVQGEGAAEEIAAAVRRFDQDPEAVDVIVVTRGGGSLEDLWAFNEEVVARALAASPIPTISAVGHDVDFTIADFVADARAQTPTHASELVVPEARELQDRLAALGRRMGLASRALVSRAEDRWQRCRTHRLFRDPQVFVQERLELCDRMGEGLDNRLYNRMREWEDSVFALAGRLGALSPLKVLARGYSVVTTEEGPVVSAAGQVDIGERLRILLAQGELRVTVGERVTTSDDEGEGSRGRNPNGGGVDQGDANSGTQGGADSDKG